MINDWLAVLAARLVEALRRRPDPGTGPVVAAILAEYPAEQALDEPGPGPSEQLAQLLTGDDRVTRLAGLLALEPDQVMVLLAAVAPELDANLGIGLGAIAGSATAGFTTVHAALELAQVTSASPRVGELLGAGSVLVRHGLVDVIGDGPRLQRRVRPAPRLVAHLAGSDDPDPELRPTLVDVVAVDGDEVAGLVRVLGTGARLIWLRGPTTSARMEVAAAALAAFGIGALAVDLSHTPLDDAARIARAAVREAVLTGRALVVGGVDALAARRSGDDGHAGTTAVVRAVADLLVGAVVPVVAVAETTWQPQWWARRPFTVDIGPTRAEEVRRLWGEKLADVDGIDDSDMAALLAVQLAPHDIADAVRYARLIAAARSRPVDLAIVQESIAVITAVADGG